MAPNSQSTFRFGDFELDAAAFDLSRGGQSVRLEKRPMDLLLLLVESRGQLISRPQIAEKLWGKSVFIDVDLGVNTAIRKVRQALQDDSDSPRFIETVSGRGYRFIAPVETVSNIEVDTRKRVTLAVLPFENLGGDPARDYLVDGLTEEAIAAIGQIDADHLAVIGRTSVNHYKRTTKSLAEIASELNAIYLLEGSVRAEGDRLRITARLISAYDQAQIWSATYDSEPGSVLTLQRELSSAIAEQVRLKLMPERLTALAQRQSHNAAAYDLYLRGRYFWNQLTPASTRRALEYYRQATDLDRDYALAWSGLADAYASSVITSDVQPSQVWPLAKEAAAHAIRSAESLAESQTSLGFVNLFLNWDWPVAEAAFRRAVVHDGNNPLAHRMLGVVLSHLQRHEEALRSIKRARELDPFYAMYHALSTMLAFHSGDYSAALEFGRQSIVVDPEFWIGYFQLAQVYEQLGKNDLALEALANAGRFSGGNSKVVGLRGYILAKIGRHDEARQVITTLDSISRERYIPPYASALIHAGLNEHDATFQWLDRAFEARDVHLIFLPVDPKWNAFRTDPRFAALLQRCKFTST
jgi:TolB-like protein/Tfp pilus assembly protein PilF